jgi:hypothetical protein
MTPLLRRLRCRLFGHPDTEIHWGGWRSDPECGRYRVVKEVCVRCSAVLSHRLLMESDLIHRTSDA